MNYRKDILTREDDIRKWISELRSKSYICKQLQCKPSTLEKYLHIFKIDYKGNQGSRHVQDKGYKCAMYYITSNKPINSHKLKIKLIKDGIKEARCECCGNDVWMNMPIHLELHHIDGNHFNNSLSNLQLLCPNCHALSDTNSGKNNSKHRQRCEFVINTARSANLDDDSIILELNSHRLSRSRNNKHTIEESVELRKIGKVDSLGRVSDSILTEDEWKKRKDVIINSGVDLKKYGWRAKVEKVTGLTRRQIYLTEKHFHSLFDDITYKK